MTRLLSKHMFLMSQACRDEIAELGEIGATFLAVWLIFAVTVLIGLMFFWVLLG
jgi:hypothetical protein